MLASARPGAKAWRCAHFSSLLSRSFVSKVDECGLILASGQSFGRSSGLFKLRWREMARAQHRNRPFFRCEQQNVTTDGNASAASDSEERRARSSVLLPFSAGLRHPMNGSKFNPSILLLHRKFYSSQKQRDGASPQAKKLSAADGHSERAVVTALWCNFFVLALKCGVWAATGSHVLLAEAVHSLADLANQGLLAYGLVSSRRAPDALHPYGYSKERFVWSLISAVGIFCLGSGATIVHGFSNLWNAEPIENLLAAAVVIGGSMVIEGGSLYVAINAVKEGAAAEGMKWQDYIWQGRDPTSVAVMMEDGAAVTGLVIAAASLTAVHVTGNPIWDPLGSILVGHLLGMVAIFLIRSNRQALLGRSMDPKDVKRVLDLLSADPVVDAVYDCKSEVIGPGSYRFKAEIDFDGVVVVQNYLDRIGREAWMKEFQEAAKDPRTLETALSNYGEEVVAALGSEVDRLEKEIQKIVPGVRHVDIEAHNPKGPVP